MAGLFNLEHQEALSDFYRDSIPATSCPACGVDDCGGECMVPPIDPDEEGFDPDEHWTMPEDEWPF